MTLGAVVTWNLVFKGVIGGLITSLIAMGIVLVYRSSRVINFAVGSIGIPAAALFAVMAGVHGWPYWPSLVLSLLLGTLTGFNAMPSFAFAFVITQMGFLGGLVMSAIKRDAGVKDYGHLIAGHGGAMDRVDSLAFAAPVFFHLVRYFYSVV